jgi:hypothetical protein
LSSVIFELFRRVVRRRRESLDRFSGAVVKANIDRRRAALEELLI